MIPHISRPPSAKQRGSGSERGFVPIRTAFLTGSVVTRRGPRGSSTFALSWHRGPMSLNRHVSTAFRAAVHAPATSKKTTSNCFRPWSPHVLGSPALSFEAAGSVLLRDSHRDRVRDVVAAKAVINGSSVATAGVRKSSRELLSTAGRARRGAFHQRLREPQRSAWEPFPTRTYADWANPSAVGAKTRDLCTSPSCERPLPIDGR